MYNVFCWATRNAQHNYTFCLPLHTINHVLLIKRVFIPVNSVDFLMCVMGVSTFNVIRNVLRRRSRDALVLSEICTRMYILRAYTFGMFPWNDPDLCEIWGKIFEIVFNKSSEETCWANRIRGYIVRGQIIRENLVLSKSLFTCLKHVSFRLFSPLLLRLCFTLLFVKSCFVYVPTTHQLFLCSPIVSFLTMPTSRSFSGSPLSLGSAEIFLETRSIRVLAVNTYFIIKLNQKL